MKIKYKNFRRLTSAGSLEPGVYGIITQLVIALTCFALAYFLNQEVGFSFLFIIPGLVCLYGVCVETVALLKQ
ncbi:hypothetical protein [uncultured Pseudoteredinibacter sp.]|uniref:hypothetical protein n=1 Tax=uncultured Pseudoteredinibacter sp. TaxID=1641701 RepID=UPI002604567F|nr:hypothetical protein [uncultured Pseudoteredinibacter sp.]